MNPDTHSENNKPENVQASDASKDAGAGNPDQTQDNSAAVNAEPDETASAGPKPYVDPSIAAVARIGELEAQVAAMQEK